MWINYNDSEVAVFHPIVGKCIFGALKRLGLDTKFEVVHEPQYSRIVPDFVVVNRTTKKIILIVEVKRTKADVQSTRFQYQAMSYCQELKNHQEKSYYILTNLEYAYFFKYSESRPRPLDQVIKPGFAQIGNLRVSGILCK